MNNNKTPNLSSQGFTLLEIMIVLAIITGILVLGATSIKTPSTDVRTDIRKLLILTKRLKQKAQLDQKIYRLTFEFGKDQNKYWVESSDKKIIAKASNDTFDNFNNDDEKTPDFQVSEYFTKEKLQLPEGFFFKQLYLMEQDIVFENGIGHIHFFPQGIADSAALQITNEGEKMAWTIVVNALTGNSHLLDGLFDHNALNRE